MSKYQINNNYIFEGFEFSTDGLNHQVYDGEWHRGIIYYLDEGCFDLVLNKIGWARININYINGETKDLPFNENTIKLLPNEIKVRKI